MKSLILSLALLTIVLAVPQLHELHSYTFQQYIKDFNKGYTEGTLEYKIRKHLFETKLQEVLHHNNKGNKSYKKGINIFSDLTKEEFKKSLGHNKGMRGFLKAQEQQKLFLAPKNTYTKEYLASLPTTVDWRQKGVLNDVKDQGSCGSCWAFASVGVLESHAAISSGKLLSLSEEQLVACMPNPQQCGGTGGCSGAIAELAFDYVHQNGMTLESSYPYSSYGGNTGSCQYNNATMKSAISVDGFVRLASNSYNDLLNAVATVGPVAVSVDASLWSDYSGGIFDECDFSQNIDIDHAVVVVGYGSDSTGDYWIVRNSWGTSYGENGYIRVKRDTGNQQCGTDSTPLDGFACAGQTSPIQVCGQCGILSDSAYPTGVKVLA